MLVSIPEISLFYSNLYSLIIKLKTRPSLAVNITWVMPSIIALTKV